MLPEDGLDSQLENRVEENAEIVREKPLEAFRNLTT
jgi:hypothetical protein